MDKLITPKTARKVLIILGLILAAATYSLKDLKLDYDFERFFPQEDPKLDYYLEFRETFGTDNDFLFLSINVGDGVLSPVTIEKLKTLSAELKEVSGVKQVLNPYDLSIPVMGPIGAFKVPLIGKNPDKKVLNDPLLKEKLISKDQQHVGMIISHEQNPNKERSDEILAGIVKVLEASDIDYRMAGKIYGQNYYINTMAKELQFFAATSVICLILFLYISFKSFWAVLLPIIVVASTVILDLSVITITGNNISVLTTILPTILFVVGVSDVVHLKEKYLQELRVGKSKLAALKEAYKKVGLATLLTSITTAVGFFTLLSSSIIPISDFGWFAGVGVLLAFLLAFSLYPAVLILLPTPGIITTKRKNFWKPILTKALGFSLRKQGAIYASFAVLVGLSIWAITQIKINNYLLEDLSENDPHRKDFMFFEQQYGGVRPFEMGGSFEGELYTLANIRSLDSLENYLSDTYGVNNLISPLTPVKLAHRAQNGGSAAAFKLPETEAELKRLDKLISKINQSNPRPIVVDKQFRISGNVVDEGGAVFAVKNDSLNRYLAEHISKGLEIKQTGMGLLIDENNKSLSRDMLLGLLIAFAVVGLLMGFLYRSAKMVIIALVPNVIPLLLIGGFMYAYGIDLKLSTAIIFTIAFGIAVDDTIHFLAQYHLERRRGYGKLRSIALSYYGAGKAIVVTSIILFSGFFTLIGSSFSSTFYLGLLVSLTLLLAVITDLLLLPGLLYLVDRKD